LGFKAKYIKGLTMGPFLFYLGFAGDFFAKPYYLYAEIFIDKKTAYKFGKFLINYI